MAAAPAAPAGSFAGRDFLLNAYANDNALFNDMYGGAESRLFAGTDWRNDANAAKRNVTLAFSSLPGMLTRRRSSLGSTAGEGQVAGETRRISLQRAVADADAQTRAIWATKGNRLAAQDYATGAYAQELSNSARLASGVAGMEAQREADFQSQWDNYQQQRARRRGGILGLAGTVLGFAIGGPAGAKVGGSIGGSLGG